MNSEQFSDKYFGPNATAKPFRSDISVIPGGGQSEPTNWNPSDSATNGCAADFVSMLADLIKSASERTQVVVSTQSPTLLDYFEPAQIVVVNRVNGKSTFERLDPQTLAAWMEDYSVGELWQKNVVQGGPARE